MQSSIEFRASTLYLTSSEVTAAQEKFYVLILKRYQCVQMYSLACSGVTLKNVRI